VMRKSGLALMGTGIASGKDRAAEAVERALNSPLLNNSDIRGAKNILLNITSGTHEVTMDEVGIITDYLQNKAGFEADLIWGNGKDETLGEEISVTLIATGFGKSSISAITGEHKLEKENVVLNVTPPVQPVQAVATPVYEEEVPASVSVYNKVETEHEIKEPEEKELEFEVLYPKTMKERNSPKDNVRMDFSSASDEDLDELENIPAYKRRQLRMNDPKYKKKFSNYSVTSENKITDKNSYLHGQVD
jgi:cell division protein FtsZ